MAGYARYMLILVLSTMASAAASGAESESPMLDVLIKIIPRSDEVLAGVVRGNQPVTVEGEKFVRAQADVVEVFKSGPERPKTIAVDVKDHANETARTTEGETYVFFLRRGIDGKEAGRRFLVDLSRPLRVPAEKRGVYFELIRDYVTIAAADPAKRDLKGHVLKVLRSGIPFFHEDAARTANLVKDWSPAELEKIREILAPKGREIAATGIERDNLVALVLMQGTATQALAQSRLEFKQGNPDGVFYGLSMRTGPDVDALLKSFFEEADPAVRLGGLRLAGLLKKTVLLDQFEQKNGQTMDEKTRSALSEARKLVLRD